MNGFAKAAHDLNLAAAFGGILRHARRQNGVLPNNGSCTALGVSTTGPSTRSSRRSPTVFLVGSLSGVGLRADDVSREPARHRSMPGHPRPGVSSWLSH